MQRALLITQLLAPPLPMLCVGANGEERISSSHDLLWVLFGRLFAAGALAVGSPPPPPPPLAAAATTGDVQLVAWHEYILNGPHTETLLRALILQQQQETPDDVGPPAVSSSTKYQAFCDYTRAVISIAVKADVMMQSSRGSAMGQTRSEWGSSSSSGGGGQLLRMQDVRFMQDIARVSEYNSGTLVQSTVAFHRSLVIFRLGESEQGGDDDGEEASAFMMSRRMGAVRGNSGGGSRGRRRHRDHYDTLCGKCMQIIESIAAELLKSL